MKILIFGLPGSGKTTLAEPLAELLDGVHINADAVRAKYNDWDFSIQGRFKQAQRMRHLADGVVMAGKVAIADFVCPIQQARDDFEPDFTVWMDTITEGRYDDTNMIFQNPSEVDYHISGWFDDTPEKLAAAIRRFMENQDEV